MHDEYMLVEAYENAIVIEVFVWFKMIDELSWKEDKNEQNDVPSWFYY